MTDLDTRIADLREDHHDASAWTHEALSIIDEQAREIERLRARVAELERAAMSIPDCDVGWDSGSDEHYRDAGPTPLRGRVTGRNREYDEGRN